MVIAARCLSGILIAGAALVLTAPARAEEASAAVRPGPACDARRRRLRAAVRLRRDTAKPEAARPRGLEAGARILSPGRHHRGRQGPRRHRRRDRARAHRVGGDPKHAVYRLRPHRRLPARGGELARRRADPAPSRGSAPVPAQAERGGAGLFRDAAADHIGRQVRACARLPGRRARPRRRGAHPRDLAQGRVRQGVRGEAAREVPRRADAGGSPLPHGAPALQGELGRGAKGGGARWRRLRVAGQGADRRVRQREEDRCAPRRGTGGAAVGQLLCLLARAVAQAEQQAGRGRGGDRRGHPRPGPPRRRRRVVDRAPHHRPQAARQRRRPRRLRGRQPPRRRDRATQDRGRVPRRLAGAALPRRAGARGDASARRGAGRRDADLARPRRLLAGADRRGGRGRGGGAAPLRARRRLSDHLLRPARAGKARQRACPARGARPRRGRPRLLRAAHRGAGAAPALRPRRARPRAGAEHRSVAAL